MLLHLRKMKIKVENMLSDIIKIKHFNKIFWEVIAVNDLRFCVKEVFL